MNIWFAGRGYRIYAQHFKQTTSIFLLEIYTLRFTIMKICAFWIVCDCFDQKWGHFIFCILKSCLCPRHLDSKLEMKWFIFLTLLCDLMVNAAIFSKNICEIYPWHAVPTALNLVEKKKKKEAVLVFTMMNFLHLKKVFECLHACVCVCARSCACRQWQSPLTDPKYSQLLLRASQRLHQPLAKCVIRYFQKLPVGVNT